MLQRILSAVLGLALFVVALFVTSVLVAVVLSIGLLTWAWLQWRAPRRAPARGGRVLEGEYRIIERK